MAETSGGLSGPAVGVLTVGALLVYAGFRGVSPLQALRDVSGGKPPPVASHTAGLQTGTVSGDGTPGADPNPSQQAASSPQGTRFGVAVAQAAMANQLDKYSQSPMQRTANGYSDCSSFAAKAFVGAGVTSIKTWWTTLNFRTSSQFKTIKLSEASAGDILITPLATLTGAHMAIVTAPGMAIGQQNSHSNVQTGTFDTIMAGKPGYIAMRYIGALPSQFLGGV